MNEKLQYQKSENTAVLFFQSCTLGCILYAYKCTNLSLDAEEKTGFLQAQEKLYIAQ